MRLTNKLAALGCAALLSASAALPASAQALRPAAAHGLTTSDAAVTEVQWRRGGHWGHGHHRYHRHGHGWGPGAAALGFGLATGALIGGAIAADAYDDEYVEVPSYGSSDVHAYCASKFKSYDPSSGTYMGYDGIRKPCP